MPPPPACLWGYSPESLVEVRRWGSLRRTPSLQPVWEDTALWGSRSPDNARHATDLPPHPLLGGGTLR
ncbi:unnamed protein product [Boreogadus saida]